jgi:hypothetical protein
MKKESPRQPHQQAITPIRSLFFYRFSKPFLYSPPLVAQSSGVVLIDWRGVT